MAFPLRRKCLFSLLHGNLTSLQKPFPLILFIFIFMFIMFFSYILDPLSAYKRHVFLFQIHFSEHEIHYSMCVLSMGHQRSGGC
jgi:hypothetical protein